MAAEMEVPYIVSISENVFSYFTF